MFCANLDMREEIELCVDFSSFGTLAALERVELYSENPEDKNTFDKEYNVIPKSIPLESPENKFRHQSDGKEYISSGFLSFFSSDPAITP